MYFILDNVDKYLKKEGINPKYTRVFYDNFPDYFNQAILYLLREIDSPGKFSMGLRFYRFMYDEHGVLHLRAVTDDKEHSLLICSNPVGLSTSFSAKVVSEKKVLEYAICLKQLRPQQLALRNVLIRENPGKSYKEILMMEYNILMPLVKSEIERRSENGDYILSNINMEEMLKGTVDKVNAVLMEDYMGYLDWRKSREMEHIVDLYFSPRTGVSNPKTLLQTIKGSIAKGRVNMVIPTIDRINLLEGRHYIYKGTARSVDTIKKDDYLCYLYLVGDKQYALVLEPVNGMGYTNIVYLNREWFYEDDFSDIARQYLELTEEEVVRSKNVIRLSHTTYSTFKNNLELALTGDNNIPSKPYIKKKVRKFIGQEEC